MEKEFSITKYLKYVVRKWLVVLLCFVLGIGAAVIISVISDSNKMQIYEGSIVVNFNEYVEANRVGASEPITDGEYSLYDSNVSTLLNNVINGDLKNKTYEAVKEEVYPSLSAKQRETEFFKNFIVRRDGMTLSVGFVYECRTEEDVKIAKGVVNEWLSLAIERIKHSDPVFNVDDNGPATVVEADREYDVSHEDYSKLVGDLEGQSLVSLIVIGAIAGLVIGVVVATVIYALDKRIKSVDDLLPDGKNKVLSASAEFATEEAFINLYAAAFDKNVKKLLLAFACDEAKADDFANAFVAYAKECGIAYEIKKLDDWKKERFEADAPTIYIYNGKDESTISYLSNRVEATAIVADHAEITAKQFEAVVCGIKNEYLGVSIYNVNDSYLD